MAQNLPKIGPFKIEIKKKTFVTERLVTSKSWQPKIHPLGFLNMQKSRPHLASLSTEKYNYFLRYLAFFGAKMGPKPNEGGVKDQVSTTFSEAPPSSLTYCKRILVVAVGKLELFQL